MQMFGIDRYGDNLSFISENGEKLTYRQLNDNVDSVSAVIKPHRMGLILCKNDIGSILGYLSFLNSDSPALLIDGDKSNDALKLILDTYNPQYLWVPEKREGDFNGEVTLRNNGYSLIETGSNPYEIHPDLALLLTTSGSTGSPKLVKLTKRNLLSNAESISQYLEIDESERPITSLPMYYSYGLSVINSHLLKGAAILLTDKPVIQKEFWNFARQNKATSIAGVPYTYEMLRRLKIFNMDIPSLRTLTQAGGKMKASLVKEFVENAKASGKRFIVMYGQTEATARISYTPEEHALDKYGSIGIAIPGGKLSIENNETEGELIYEGENVSLGYAESIVDLKVGDENHGVLHTGDIAKIDEDGYFYITGRKKRFVKVWGNRCNLDSIEQIVKEMCLDCACAGVDDKITVFITTEGIENEIKHLLVDRTNLNPRAFSVKVINEIPKNASGKILYSELQNLI